MRQSVPESSGAPGASQSQPLRVDTAAARPLGHQLAHHPRESCPGRPITPSCRAAAGRNGTLPVSSPLTRRRTLRRAGPARTAVALGAAEHLRRRRDALPGPETAGFLPRPQGVIPDVEACALRQVGGLPSGGTEAIGRCHAAKPQLPARAHSLVVADSVLRFLPGRSDAGRARCRGRNGACPPGRMPLNRGRVRPATGALWRSRPPAPRSPVGPAGGSRGQIAAITGLTMRSAQPIPEPYLAPRGGGDRDPAWRARSGDSSSKPSADRRGAGRGSTGGGVRSRR